MRWTYGAALGDDPRATLDDLRESVKTFVELERTARYALGISHPTAVGIERALERSRAVLRAREGKA